MAINEKYTAEQIVKALRETKGMIYVAARKLGCAPQTIYNYAKRYPIVQQTIDEERGLMVDTAELALWKALNNGEAWAISLTLKTIGKSRGYIERSELTGKDGEPLGSDLSANERAARLIELLQRVEDRVNGEDDD